MTLRARSPTSQCHHVLTMMFYVFYSHTHTDSSYRDMSALNVPGIATSVPVGVPMFPRPPVGQQLGSEVRDILYSYKKAIHSLEYC